MLLAYNLSEELLFKNTWDEASAKLKLTNICGFLFTSSGLIGSGENTCKKKELFIGSLIRYG